MSIYILLLLQRPNYCSNLSLLEQGFDIASILFEYINPVCICYSFLQTKFPAQFIEWFGLKQLLLTFKNYGFENKTFFELFTTVHSIMY